MDSGAFIIGIVLLAVAMGYIIWPWFKAREAAAHNVTVAEPGFLSEDTSPDAEHEELISALRDLEFDYMVEKVGEADYHSLRNNLLAQLAELATRKETATDSAIDELLNRARAEKSAAPACSHCGESLRPGANFCVYCGQTVTRQQCPDCGSPVTDDDQFCAICGFNLEISPAKV